MGQFATEEAGLKIIKVKTEDILKQIKENRESHSEEFKSAHAGFMIDSENRMKRALKDIKAGKIPKGISFEEPEDHTDDYDTIIAMLEMTTDTELEITYEQFLRYARDKWSWSSKFARLSNLYNN